MMKEKKEIFVKRIEDMDDEEIRRQQEEVKARAMPPIRTLDFLYKEAGEVTYEYPELTAVCPMTGIQDLYTVRITYVPDAKVPELKSLREYFLAYRDIPILHEHLAHKILEDFENAVKPSRVTVQLNVAIRGGITTTIRIVR
ncbi:MAG: preQ(1) synthase [bacterium]